MSRGPRSREDDEQTAAEFEPGGLYAADAARASVNDVETVIAAVAEAQCGWEAEHAAAIRKVMTPGLDAAEIAVLQKALKIGAISHDGDGWFAMNAGYDYDDAEETLDKAHLIVAALALAAPEE